MDAAYDDINVTIDPDQRREKVHAFQRMIIEKQPPILYLYSPYSYVQFRDYVKGIVPGAGDASNYNFRIWLDESSGPSQTRGPPA